MNGNGLGGRSLQVAIDGPAGAGKSTYARALAQMLGAIYLDTGAMYRAVGLKALREGVSTQDEKAVGALVERTDILVVFKDGGQAVLLDGEDVTGLIRTPEVSMAASDVSRWPGVRRRLVALQQQIAGRRDVVMDGRDIGTTVLPDAQFKFFVTASPEVRARRRQAELKQKGIEKPFEECLRDIEDRDRQDSSRAASPLVVADGAEVVDTSDRSADEVVKYLMGKVRPAYEGQ